MLQPHLSTLVPLPAVRRWIKQEDIDAGRAEGLSTDERAEPVRLRWENRVPQTPGRLALDKPPRPACRNRVTGGTQAP